LEITSITDGRPDIEWEAERIDKNPDREDDERGRQCERFRQAKLRACPGRHQGQGGERHDEAERLDQYPEQASRGCNHRQRQDVKARHRLAGEHDRAGDQDRPERRQQDRE
jgi:hypothetical protein